MRSPLDLIEARLQNFIESSLNFLPGDRSQNALAHQLAAAIQQAVTQEPTGALISTNQFTVCLHPINLAIWELHPGLSEGLCRVLNEAARESGIELFSPLRLQWEADDTLSEHDFTIQTAPRTSKMGETSAVPVHEARRSQKPHPNQAFLILNGEKILALSQPVINLGRRQDNQIVIDDLRISRVHAQLRAIRGRYILFDLNSTGGTYVNGVQITQQALNPGDVISLAGFPIIYSEEQLPTGSPSPRSRTGRLDLRHDPPTH